nr:PREDICTED: cathepsin B-like cysteine proteinase 4 [Bemisia tabaci]
MIDFTQAPLKFWLCARILFVIFQERGKTFLKKIAPRENYAVLNPGNHLRHLWKAVLLSEALALLPVSAREIIPDNSKTFSLKNQDQMIEYINQVQSSWKAGKNFHDDTPSDYLRRLASAWISEEKLLLDTHEDGSEVTTYTSADPPAEFDARKKWTNCPSVAHIYDQGSCGSCWAVAVASVVTDKICIASKGAWKDWISSWDIASCCVGGEKCGAGCDGGRPDKAFEYYVKKGIPTGGEFGSNQGCMPYEIKGCSHHMGDKGKFPNCRSYNETVVPTCVKECPNKSYKTPLNKDRHFGKRVYHVKIGDAKKELSEIGPCTMSFQIYEDFYLYKSGVYKHVTGAHIGGHVVRVLGYGTENGIGYWLCANSWNPEWGDNGLFKIIAGTNDCNCEQYFYTAEPKL